MIGSSRLKPLFPSMALWIPVKDIIMHPRYWGQTFIIGDVALLRLRTPVTFSKHVQPICLPEPGLNLKVGTQCWVTGWSQVKQRFSGEPPQNPTAEPTPFPSWTPICDAIEEADGCHPGTG